jgi:hypothetical protein
VEKVTKAKPRGRPVSRSEGRYASTTFPTSESRRVSSSLEVWKFRLPTKILAEMAALLRVGVDARA